MSLNGSNWIAIVDGRGGRLLRCKTVPPGRTHVDEVDGVSCENDSHERTRPSPRRGMMGNTADKHADDEQLRRSAKQLTQWLGKMVEQRTINELVLFCPPRMSGALARMCPPTLSGRIKRRSGELMSFGPAALAHHPAIRAVLHPELPPE